MNCIICLIGIFSVFFIFKPVHTLDSSNSLYQQDISEFCRRKVISSVFLGHHVVEANSKMMHFSRLDVPYNCIITIRTESGNHIILVIQVDSKSGLEESCRLNGDQLLVFQASESFGGYWAVPPQAISRDISALQSTVYTMPPIFTETTVNSRINPNITESQENTVTTDSIEKSTPQLDVIEIEIPILNATGRLVPGDKPLQPPWDREDNIDKFNDASPKAGVSYDREVVPLVQVWTNTSGRRNQEEQLFDISYNEDLLRPSFMTQTMNVTEPTIETTTKTTTIETTTSQITNGYKLTATTQTKIQSTETVWNPYTLSTSRFYGRHYRPRSTVRNIFQKRPMFTLRNKKLSRTTPGPALEEYWSYGQTENLKSNPTKNLTTMSTPGTSNYEFNENTKFWEGHRPVNNAINKAYISRLKDFTSFTKNRIIQSASDNPFKNFMKSRATLMNEPTFQRAEANYPLHVNKNTKFLHLEDYSKLYGNDQSSTKTTSPNSETTEALKIVVDNIPIDNVKSTNEEILSGIQWKTADFEQSASSTSMDEMSFFSHPFKSTKFDAKRKFVNHESWENLVHVAPEMAALAKYKHEETTSSESPDATLLRKKRYLEKISIENARPELIVKSEYTTSNDMVEPNIFEDFAQLIELTDDEITGRLSLHQINNVIAGQAMFNVCDYQNDPKSRYVILLDTSRVVLLINNYTLRGMTIVTTSANTLYDTEEKCNQAQLECQVSAHRVCIQSSCACDGIPNCGSYDIYDEDRLRCGSTDTDYDVYLAIMAFLSLILTLIYAVYFWLQRCVPQVSKAFFVYIAGTENDLYLKTIMRSPHDMDDLSKLPYHPDDFESSSYFNTQQKVGVFKYLCLMCIRCITCSETKVDEKHTNDDVMQRMYSFTEFEINKMGVFNVDVAVQTGDSLEKMNNQEKISQLQKHTTKNTKLNHTQMSKLPTLPHPNVSIVSNTQQEMRLLNMFNKSRSDVSTTTVPHPNPMFEPERMITERNHDREEELNVFDLHKHDNSTEQLGDSISSNNEPVHELSEITKKKLRFEDSSDMSLSNYNIEHVASTSHKHKMHPLFGMFRRGDADLESAYEEDHMEEGQQQTGQHESQLKRFWNREQHKKKSKKPGHYIPMRKL